MGIQATQRIGAHDEDTKMDVTAAIFDLSGVQWRAFDWLKIDHQLALLKPARLVFGFRSRDHMLAFDNEVSDALMPRASIHGSVVYALSCEQLWCRFWYKASQDPDVPRGTLAVFQTACLVCLRLYMSMNRTANV